MTGKKTTEGDVVVKALIEHFDDQVRRIGDGHTMLAEKMDGVADRLGRVEEKVERVEVGLVALREEMRAGDQALREEMRAGDQALREEIRAGDQALREEMEAFRAEVKSEFASVREEIRAGDEALREEISAFRVETKAEFTEVRSMIKLSYAELDARVTRLEGALADVSVRLGRLEKNAAS